MKPLQQTLNHAHSGSSQLPARILEPDPPDAVQGASTPQALCRGSQNPQVLRRGSATPRCCAGGHWKLLQRHLFGQPGATTTAADLNQDLGLLGMGLSNGTFRLYQVGPPGVHCDPTSVTVIWM